MASRSATSGRRRTAGRWAPPSAWPSSPAGEQLVTADWLPPGEWEVDVAGRRHAGRGLAPPDVRPDVRARPRLTRVSPAGRHRDGRPPACRTARRACGRTAPTRSPPGGSCPPGRGPAAAPGGCRLPPGRSSTHIVILVPSGSRGSRRPPGSRPAAVLHHLDEGRVHRRGCDGSWLCDHGHPPFPTGPGVDSDLVDRAVVDQRPEPLSQVVRVGEGLVDLRGSRGEVAREVDLVGLGHASCSAVGSGGGGLLRLQGGRSAGRAGGPREPSAVHPGVASWRASPRSELGRHWACRSRLTSSAPRAPSGAARSRAG